MIYSFDISYFCSALCDDAEAALIDEYLQALLQPVILAYFTGRNVTVDGAVSAVGDGRLVSIRRDAVQTESGRSAAAAHRR